MPWVTGRCVHPIRMGRMQLIMFIPWFARAKLLDTTYGAHESVEPVTHEAFSRASGSRGAEAESAELGELWASEEGTGDHRVSLWQLPARSLLRV